jgi:enoyl-CoA hydratase
VADVASALAGLHVPVYETLLLSEPSDGVLQVAFNRPDERNAINRTMHAEFLDVLVRLRDADHLGAVVLTGADGTFCAGASMEFFDQLIGDDPLRTMRTLEQGITLVRDLLAVRPPVIAAVNGHAMGLGATIALLCDLVVMSETARIADTHVKVGIVAGDGGTLVWPSRIGMARAKEYLLTGAAVDARLALELGLVNRVVPAPEVIPTAVAIAAELAAGPRPAIAFTKQVLNAGMLQDAALQLPLAISLEARTFALPDVREGKAAFVERRTPRWPSSTAISPSDMPPP